MPPHKILLSVLKSAPLVFWSILIFYLSSQPTRSLSEDVSQNVLIFKTIHIVVYAVMFTLAYLASYQYKINKALLLAALYTLLFAVSDEIHQLFVPTRTGKVSDIFIDTLGLVIGYYTIRVMNKLNKIKKYQSIDIKNIFKPR